MQVSDIMSKVVEFIGPDATVQEAATLLGELDFGALPVGEATDLLGVVTNRDILFRVVAAGLDSRTTRVREVMSTSVLTCRETDTLSAALDLMADFQVRRLPVVGESGGVVGWITLSDVAAQLFVHSGAVKSALEQFSRQEAVPA